MALTTDDFILHEYKARQLWEQREYSAVINHTKAAAEKAGSRGDDAGWWRMMYLLAKCQRQLGDISDLVETAESLSEHPLTSRDPELAAKANALRSAGLRALGQLPEALEVAREATLEFPETGYGSKGKLEAQQVLVAVLAESGHLDDAWREAENLCRLIDANTEPDRAGRAYWSIGNVAFLLGRSKDATEYHDKAATCFSPSRDLNLWAIFNKASAFMRLNANLVEPATLQCIERAEMAMSISGGTPQDELDIDVIRAHWCFLTGSLPEAKLKMSGIMERAEAMAPLSEGDARILYARILAAAGETEAAREQATTGMELFENVGAVMRAEQARELADSIKSVNF
ncbi:hypothetical protein GCM10009688_28780 [Arthrobacter gandavensis]|uniref:Tetratricopeptide repeat protein n=1 Tax=Arthrobacter gandavensis TaxID=169960 RepID=A0ABP5AT93_9MICC|nr:hypothetical protein [Arthrobacter citreus]